MPEIKLNLRANLLCLFRYLSAIILNYLNQFRKKSNISRNTIYRWKHRKCKTGDISMTVEHVMKFI
ncbi:hypothetical protein [Orientia tsutsugamushi]|uniref:hypothetical protein n=1 Tax=Orientia tsutsugamushi TaxID=784 RepID=UPI000D5A4934|nr:replicative DNA helicase [Orientia tsutsugamushi]